MVAGMSDPVANVDIEDVLSSIRRLVSNGPEKSGEASEDVRDADRLVLTPSQRVDDAGGAEAEALAPDRAPAGSAGLTEAHPPEIGEPESIFPEGGAEISDVVPDPPGEAEALAPGETGAPDDAETEPEPVAETGGDPELDGIAAMFARHDTAAPVGCEPDGDDEDAFADGAEAPALDWRDAGMDDETGERSGHAQDGAGPGRSGDRAATVDWDADAPDDEENAFAIEDEAVLDEEALRDLVAEIVREELMGTLGERITRNVRKLVRREIHRALNSQDFD